MFGYTIAGGEDVSWGREIDAKFTKKKNPREKQRGKKKSILKSGVRGYAVAGGEDVSWAEGVAADGVLDSGDQDPQVHLGGKGRDRIRYT